MLDKYAKELVDQYRIDDILTGLEKAFNEKNKSLLVGDLFLVITYRERKGAANASKQNSN